MQMHMLKKLKKSSASFAGLSFAVLLLVSLAACQDKTSTPAKGGDGNSQAGKAATGPAGENGPVTMTLSLSKASTTALDADKLAKAQSMLNGGVSYLLSQREADGGWSFGGGALEPALTALVLKCLLGHSDLDRNSAVVKKGFEVILKYRQPDGAIFNPKEGQASYTTAIAIMAMSAANDPQLKGAIDGGVKYLKGIQIQPGQESPDGTLVAENDPNVGGIGYGSNKTPNLSVLQFAMEAWRDAGVPADDEAMQRAAGFLTRLQNRSESNPTAIGKNGSNDGGFVYDTISSKAGMDPGGGMRSYGSMTYAGFKSMLYAGVSKDDPRIRAAYDWIRRYWRLDSNPNMPAAQSKEGLFYYHMVFARALQALGRDEIPDFKDPSIMHNWRGELVDKLAQLAQPNGSWANEADRWNEGSPTLVTCYAVMALEEALKK
jgi:squalene-hopene/tetraprenyl-beta-curcumene cyclase